MEVVGVSDVTLGFGSTQIPAFMEYIGKYYKSKVTIIQPSQTEVGYVALGHIKLYRVNTTVHIYSRAGRIEYIAKATKLLEKLRPDVLIIFTTFCLPVLFKLSYRPKFVIYYSLESISFYGPMDIEMNSDIHSKVDLIIFPEENRAVKFVELSRLHEIPICILYNCTNSSRIDDIIPSTERNRRIIYQGRLKEETGVDFFLDGKIQSIPIDLYGIIDSPNKEAIMERLATLLEGVQYKGAVDQNTISKIRKFYTYSIVYWAPVYENALYACPNKFFESIADGIPVISSPNPQCKLLLERYKCGLLMEDWSFDSYYEKIKEGLELYGTPIYDKMVQNCKKAVMDELNWPNQVGKVRRYLKNI